MLSINTNLSSMIVQNSLSQSTSKLNQAIERMSTGYKTNHASDNAANYSISTNMTTKMSAYQVAEDNVSMGLDMLTTASENLSQIESKLARLRALATQASNGTYGTQSKDAINSEANALVDEIERLYNTSEYNGIKTFKGRICETENKSFIKDIDRRDTSKMTTLASVNIGEKITSGTYSISTAEELAKLATMTNNDLIGEDAEFVLANDIDLNGYSNWIPIGIQYKSFKSTFDGNGYSISNLKIDSNSNYLGLFGYIKNADIKNVIITNANIKSGNSSNYTAILGGYMLSSTVTNIYCQGNVTSDYYYVGGICGGARNSELKYCATEGSITANGEKGFVGGISGELSKSHIDSSYSKATISGKTRVGGIVGESWADIKISNCYTKSTLNSNGSAGGIVGTTYNGLIENCISNSKISNHTITSGGIVGNLYNNKLEIINSSVLNDTDYNGILVGYMSIGNSPMASLTLYNNNYSSEISSTNKLLGNYDSLTSEAKNRYLESKTGTKCSQISSLGLNNNALVKSYDKNLNIQAGINETGKISISDLFEEYFIDLNFLKNNIVNSPAVCLKTIDSYLIKITEKQTQYGALQNRLESALDEIAIQYDNLASSRSTLRDADMAELSSQYIKMQILQQASATLLATANQSPSIALQLI